MPTYIIDPAGTHTRRVGLSAPYGRRTAVSQDEKSRIVSAPPSTDRARTESLAYLQSHDAPTGKDYAYAAYKETNPATGKWHLKIKASCTANTSLDPEHPSVRTAIAKAARAGRRFSVFGFNMTPGENDPRLVENRIHFNEDLVPTKVTLHLVTRGADGPPLPEQVAEFPWPGEIRPRGRLLRTPRSSGKTEIRELAYVDSYDAINDKDYAYLAYVEKNADSGKWVLKISSLNTAGGVLDPTHSSFRQNLEKAAASGKDHMVFGFNLQSSADDPRLVENRVCFDGTKTPTHVEIHLVTRKADGSPAPKQYVKIPWPA